MFLFEKAFILKKIELGLYRVVIATMIKQDQLNHYRPGITLVPKSGTTADPKVFQKFLYAKNSELAGPIKTALFSASSKSVVVWQILSKLHSLAFLAKACESFELLSKACLV